MDGDRKVRFVVLAAAVCTAACLDNGSMGPSVAVTIDSLVGDLRHQGVTVSTGGNEPRESFPFFSVRAKRLRIDGDDAYIFEYTTDAAATSEASTVSPSGTPIGTTQATWISPPRFYKRDRFIILYVGTNLTVVRALEAVLGVPLAQR